ncbi:MAG: DUF5013 domain-containing protein [Bacteroidaceae bacterium]|nr:DUF5013 domain-containing protein [Bacteroidaceae bacterium]
MKLRKLLLLALAATVSAVSAQRMVVDTSKYVDYVDNTNYDWSLMKWQGDRPMPGSKNAAPFAVAGSQNEMSDDEVQNRTDLPAFVNAANTVWFPPVFNQDNGSCGSASRICYMLTYELNAYYDRPGNLLENQLPSHFVWNLTYGNSGKDEFIQFVGVPSAKAYGGRTSSSIYGSYDWDSHLTGWMSGYDKWYEGFFNRAHKPSNFPVSMKYAAGRKALKSWLYDHNGDPDFKGRPGIVGIGVASACVEERIANTPANAAAGVVGKSYLIRWGTQVDHALTIVGYDDRIEFDLDQDGIYGEGDLETDEPWGPQPLEKGAWIVVNSWGPWWANGGFIYCPYAWSVPNAVENNGHFEPSSGWFQPEVYRIRKDYAPMRTIKIEMEYSRRSEVALSVGIAADLNATAPEKTIPMHHFQYAGDGHNGATNPAPEVPMLGQWNDGRLHHEPMEFGYDVTDLTEGYDRTRPLKYFFIVNRKRNSRLGHGKLHNLAIIDYETSSNGMETPFALTEETCKIDSAGADQIIYSTIVYGTSTTYAPENLGAAKQTLSWSAPIKSSNVLKGYNIYCEGVLEASVGANVLTYEAEKSGEYHVTAQYASKESFPSNKVYIAPADAAEFPAVNIVKGGFTIPDVFGTNYPEATIEYWICPNTVTNWNQSAGNWGSWMFHANADGSLTVGWDTNNRISSNTGVLKAGQWMHVAMTVKGSALKLYTGVGTSKTSKNKTAKGYSGLGGFGDLVFTSNAQNNSYSDAKYSEIRIWSKALSANEIMQNRTEAVGEAGAPRELLAYYRGDIIYINGEAYLRDCVGGHHAPISLCGELEGAKFEQTTNTVSNFKMSDAALTVDIDDVATNVMVGQPISLSAECSRSAKSLVWNAPAAGLSASSVKAPTVIFKEAGTHEVYATATDAEGNVVSDTIKVNVIAPEVSADFTITNPTCAVGQSVSFVPVTPYFGYEYDWTLDKGNDNLEKQSSLVAATTYDNAGLYSIKLNVKFNDQVLASSEKFIEVKNVAPTAAFDLSSNSIVKGNTVELLDKSKSSPTSWAWNIYNDYTNIIVDGRNPAIKLEQPGRYNVALTVSNEFGKNTKVQENAIMVSSADAFSGLNIAGGAEVQLAKVPFTSGPFTIEWWMSPSTLTNDGNLGFGHYGGTMGALVVENGQMLLEITGVPFKSKAGYVIAQEWHHYGVSFDGQTVKFYRDGVLNIEVKNDQPVEYQLSKYFISRYDYKWNGVVDEYRIWNKCLTDEKILDVCNRSLEATEDLEAAKAEGLVCYFTFNQSGGDVQDITGNGHTGVRSGFGPDGDAWSVRPGVWTLAVGQTPLSFKDVSSKYLKNYKKEFKHISKTVNPANSARFLTITNWELENADVNGNVTTGVHVDTQKDNCFTVTTGWDGFASTLNNHKVYQNVKLPAGTYEFTAKYGRFEGQCGSSYLVVAEEGKFPVTDDLQMAIAYKAMADKSSQTGSNTVTFTLEKEMTVAIGLLVNMQGDKCLTIDNFKLQSKPAEFIKADYSYTLKVGASKFTTVCLPEAVVLPEELSAYYLTSVNDATKRLQLTRVEGNVIPAETGVVIYAKNASEYVLRASEEAAQDNCTGNLLYGTLTEETVGNEQVCYNLTDKDGYVAFWPYPATTLQPNRAYFFGPQADAYYLLLTDINLDTDIDGVIIESGAEQQGIYDLTGRRVNKLNKGVYIVNGKKVIR